MEVEKRTNNDTGTMAPNSGQKNLPQKAAEHFSGQSSEWHPKVFIKTFGCQMNDRDSEIIKGMLLDAGYEFTDNPDDAGVVFFNTCSVRQKAEDKVAGNLQRLAARKKKDPDLIIGVLGCMGQRHGEMLLKEFPHVNIVAGPSNIYDIPGLIEKAAAGEKGLAVDASRRPKKGEDRSFRENGLSAFVNIMYGCDNFCSYCIVPYVRGREVSRPVKDIVNEVRTLAASGIKEVTLLGQNVNSYGKGQAQRIDFADLLAAVNKVEGVERIRFTTSHPKDAGKKLFEAMRGLDKVCGHIHLPVQSGSNKILDLMNRGYTSEEYRDKVGLLRQIVPGVGITTDIIVGFPSEKVSDYSATHKIIEDVRYNAAFIFKYSPRPPALSACLVDDVPDEIKKERNNELLKLQKKISHEKNKEMIGSVKEILIEGVSRMSENELVGRARDNTPCVFPGKPDLIGTLVNVKITGASPFTLKGDIEGQG